MKKVTKTTKSVSSNKETELIKPFKDGTFVLITPSVYANRIKLFNFNAQNKDHADFSNCFGKVMRIKEKASLNPLAYRLEGGFVFSKDKSNKKGRFLNVFELMIPHESLIEVSSKYQSKNKNTMASDIELLILKKQIEILEEHIEHPMKPGYKRQDIIAKIKKLKKEMEVEQKSIERN